MYMLDADEIANASVRWSRSRRGWQVRFANVVPQDGYGLGGKHLSNSHSTRCACMWSPCSLSSGSRRRYVGVAAASRSRLAFNEDVLTSPPTATTRCAGLQLHVPSSSSFDRIVNLG